MWLDDDHYKPWTGCFPLRLTSCLQSFSFKLFIYWDYGVICIAMNSGFKPLLVLQVVILFLLRLLCEKVAQSNVSQSFNLNDLSEGSWAFAQPGGLWWEPERLPMVELVAILAVCIGDCGDSFYNVIACFFDGNGNNLKLVFSWSLRGEVRTLGYFCDDGLIVSGPIYAEYVMWIWSATMPSWYVFLSFFLLGHRCVWVWIGIHCGVGCISLLHITCILQIGALHSYSHPLL